jgi:hypothetical protein
MRRCKTCGIEKKYSEFYFGPKGYLRWKCKACYKEDAKVWSENRRKRYRYVMSNLYELFFGCVGPDVFKLEPGAEYIVRVVKANGKIKSGVGNPAAHSAKPVEIKLTLSVVP